MNTKVYLYEAVDFIDMVFVSDTENINKVIVIEEHDREAEYEPYFELQYYDSLYSYETCFDLVNSTEVKKTYLGAL